MTLLKDLLGNQLNEVVEPVDPNLALEEQMEILEQRLAAAKRGLSFAHKLKNPAQKKKHMALIFTNLNKISGALKKVITQVGQFDRAASDYENDMGREAADRTAHHDDAEQQPNNWADRPLMKDKGGNWATA